MPDGLYWDREVETMPLAGLRRLQWEKLQAQLAYVYDRSPFYRRKFQEAGETPGDIKSPRDMAKLPFTRKDELRRNIEEHQPFGDFVAAPRLDIVRLHTSSGTTGKPTTMLWTRRDLDRWADMYARLAYSHGVRPDDIYQNAFSFGWFVAGMGGMAAYERIGCLCIPTGIGEARRQIATIREYGTTAMSCTPSFILYLAEVAREEGINPADLTLRKILIGGEPGGAIPETRRRVERAWNAKCFDGYGSLEFQPIAWECAEQAGNHICEDHMLAEVVHPSSGEPLPPGKEGVLVLTHLDKEATPLVRWWTGDVVELAEEPCGCGRTHARLVGGVRGRADDMLIVRGVNLFPSAIESVLRGIPGLGNEFQIIIDDEVYDPATRGLRSLKLIAEYTSEVADLDLMRARIAREIRDRLVVSAQAEVVPVGTLPRTMAKAARVVRRV